MGGSNLSPTLPPRLPPGFRFGFCPGGWGFWNEFFPGGSGFWKMIVQFRRFYALIFTITIEIQKKNSPGVGIFGLQSGPGGRDFSLKFSPTPRESRGCPGVGNI